MADSLRDQLVKAGLGSASQARKAERQSRAAQQSQGGKSNRSKDQKSASNDSSDPAAVRERARQQQSEKAERDRTMARAQNEKSAARAVRAEIKQIILQNDQRKTGTREDDVPYNFVHGKKIKKIYVPRSQQEQLSSGVLVLVNNDGLYHLVAASVAGCVRLFGEYIFWGRQAMAPCRRH